MVGVKNSSLVDPSEPSVSVRALGRRVGLAGQLSVRALLGRRDHVRITRWGFCIVTLTGTPRTTTLDRGWFDTLFSDPEGVCSYFRQMSGARRLVEWDVFTPAPLMSSEAKKQLDAGGPASTIDGFRKAAKGLGVPVDSYDHFMWFIDDGVSTSGTTVGDSLVGAIDFTTQLATHEMTHAFGVTYHADRNELDDYNDPFCVMGQGPVARSFENRWLTIPAPSVYTHSTTGPGICAPYLYVAGWLDYRRNVVEIDVEMIPRHAGETVTLDANLGAPIPDSPARIALVFGSTPTDILGDAQQYWLEYRIPRRFDRGVDRPVSTNTPDMPPAGVVVLHEVKMDTARGAGLHAIVRDWKGASPGNTIAVPGFPYQVKIAGVDPGRQQCSLAIALK
jgi:hypothetical protein